MSDEIDDAGPAFPVKHRGGEDFYPGMSLRAWLAGHAMTVVDASLPADAFAKQACIIADALIAELNK